jgi:hypothetical protein
VRHTRVLSPIPPLPSSDDVRAQLQYAGFAIDGTADLPAGGTIRVECLSSVGAGTLPFVGISRVAESVAGISTLP